MCRPPVASAATGYGVRVLPSARPLLLAVAALALVGCATVRPASTVPPTGWPADPTTTGRPSASTSASTSASVSPTATPTAAAILKTVTYQGVEVPVPAGYTDATALVAEDQSDGPARLVAFLRNPGQHTITVLWLTSDKQDLASYLVFYAQSTAAGHEQTVVQQATATVAGIPGAKLTLKNASDGSESTVLVAMRSPGSLLVVQGASTTAERLQALTTVASGLKLLGQG